MPWLMRASSRLARDERGIALPMALLALLILATLVISFVLLATSEPLIATNQKLVAQARALAESGIERAIWALNNPTDPNGVPNPLVGPAPAPYDGSAPIALNVNDLEPGKHLFYYPDVMVTCEPRDTNAYFKEFPKVIVEVLSEATERTDRREQSSGEGHRDAGPEPGDDADEDRDCRARHGREQDQRDH